MVETVEVPMPVSFIEKPLEESKPARCVDGRPCADSELGGQMLGGSNHLLALNAIFNDEELNVQTVKQNLRTLKSKGVEIGAHRGENRNEENSDCGAADKLPEIISAAQSKRDEITDRLSSVYDQNEDEFKKFDLPPFRTILDHAYDIISAYDTHKIKVKGEKLVSTIEESGGIVETVQGSHKEEVAFVNIKPRSTLDTIGLNKEGRQAFNLDLTVAVSQAKKLGVPESFSVPASLILYQATEMVLVEDKGKPALPVQLNS